MRKTISADNAYKLRPKRYVIIGGVAGGMSAATRLRRLDEFAKITVVERSGYVSFANCGLPYYVGGVIENRESLLLQTPTSLKERFALDVFINTEAMAINATAHTVAIKNLVTAEESEIEYDELILSPGARPILPPIPGIERALALRNIEDTDRIAAAIENAKTAVVIGGGFIGIEITENLVQRGIKVTLIEASAQVMNPIDPELASLIHTQLRENNVNLLLENTVTEVTAAGVKLKDGTKVAGDVVIAAIGVRPDTQLAEIAGITIGTRGGIAVDEQLRTSDPHIWAVGDAVEKKDGLTLESTLVPLANTANRQGRVLADILCGIEGKERPVLGTAIVGIFGLQVAATGWNEKRLCATGKPYRVIHTHTAAHAGYYPGASTLHLKLLVDSDTDQILGAQVVGKEGADKRIDVIATAIAGGLKASQLADRELAYAPAFGSAKDAVNILGYVNQNNASGLTESVQWHELNSLLEGGALLLDVRTSIENKAGSIPGAINIPLHDLRAHLSELPKEREIIVHCAVGLRGHIAVRLLKQYGFKARNLDGGYQTWQAGSTSY